MHLVPFAAVLTLLLAACGHANRDLPQRSVHRPRENEATHEES